jgi:hypothetical protein
MKSCILTCVQIVVLIRSSILCLFRTVKGKSHTFHSNKFAILSSLISFSAEVYDY